MENPNENKEEVDEVVEDIVETKDDEGNDTTDWKTLALKKQGIAKRYKTKLDKAKLAKEEEVKPDLDKKPKDDPEKKSDELDYGQKAFLVANGIKGADEIALVKDVMSGTGKSLDEVVENKHFLAELKDLRDKQATKDATPTGSGRAKQSTADTVDYWINKKDSKGRPVLPEDRKLRQDVVNARIKTDKNKSPFINN